MENRIMDKQKIREQVDSLLRDIRTKQKRLEDIPGHIQAYKLTDEYIKRTLLRFDTELERIRKQRESFVSDVQNAEWIIADYRQESVRLKSECRQLAVQLKAFKALMLLAGEYNSMREEDKQELETIIATL
jgi:hypothetical protein